MNLVTAGRDHAAQNLQRLIDGTEELVETLRKDGGRQYRHVLRRMERDIARAKSQLDDFNGTLGARTRAVARGTGQLVRAHPWETAAAAALLVGGAIALLMRRKLF